MDKIDTRIIDTFIRGLEMETLENHMVLPHADPDESEPTELEGKLESLIAELDMRLNDAQQQIERLQSHIDNKPKPIDPSQMVWQGLPAQVNFWFHKYRLWANELEDLSDGLPPLSRSKK